VNYVEHNIKATEWFKITDITTAHALLAVTARMVGATGLVAGEFAVLYVDEGQTAFDLRVVTDGSENDANTIQMYAARGADSWSLVAQFASVQGKQKANAAGTKFFADSITVVEKDALFGNTEYCTAINQMCHVVVSTKGYDRFLFIVSVLAATTVTIETAKMNVAP